MGYGLEVAVVGVTVVFAFLTALVLSLQALGWFFRTFGHRFPEPDSRSPGGTGASGSGTGRIAAIVAAVEVHRRQGRP